MRTTKLKDNVYKVLVVTLTTRQIVNKQISQALHLSRSGQSWSRKYDMIETNRESESYVGIVLKLILYLSISWSEGSGASVNLS